MDWYRVRLLTTLFFCIYCADLSAQGNCIPTGNNQTTVNFACGINCDTVALQVPHIKSTSGYSFTTIPYNPLPFVTAGGNELTVLYADDEYSEIVPIPFGFCFYDSVFSRLVVGSNGLITFDTANALCANAWTINPTIPFAGGLICSVSATYYPRASIMGAYTDLDPRLVASPPERKIEWRVEGTAPCRKMVISFYHVGLYGTSCGQSTPTTFQIILYESTGIIDVQFEQKLCSSTTNAGRGIMGIQNWMRNQAVAAPGKNSTSWTVQNEAFRFIPSGGTSRFVTAQMYTLSGTLVGTADTSTTTAGLLNLVFPNVCPTGSSQQFIVRTTYSSCSDPSTFLISDDTITVNKTTTLGATATTVPVNCTSSSYGSITVNVPPGNGVPPYQFSLNGGPLQSSPVFSNLAAGNYTVLATDPNGCSSVLNVTINRTGTLGVGTSITNPVCSGVNNGSITVLPPSLFTPIQYSLNGGPPQASNIFTNLAPNTYTIAVADAIGCTGTTTVTVNPGIILAASVNTTSTSCSGASNGTILVTPTNGTAPYQYSLNGGPAQASNTFSGLAAGTYSISVTDAAGCTLTNLNATILGGSSLNAGITKTDVSCNGGSNGTITATINNGTPPFQFSLDSMSWQASGTFTGLVAGTYIVYFRDNNNCTGSQTVTITQPSVLNSSVSTQAVTCFGQSNGLITITPSGGTPPYQYSVDGTNYQAGNTFSIPAGSYTVYLRDNNGCIRTQNVTVSQPASILLNVATQNASCNGGPDGRITASATGGNGTFQYSIDGVNFQSSNTFNVLPGTYTVIVRDANNCTASQSVTVGLTSNLTLTPVPDQVICEGNSVQLQVSSNANQYSWSPAAGLSSSTVSNPMASPVTTTQYVVTATLGSCSLNDTMIVNVNPAPVPDAGPDGDICFGQTYQLQGSGGVQFLWSPSASLNSTSVYNPITAPAQTTVYSLHVVGANGCSSLIPDQVKVNVTPPIIVITSPKDTVVFNGDQFQLQATSAGTFYTWSPQLGLSNAGIPDPVITVSGDITYTVVATTSAGCRGEAEVTVKVYNGPEIYVPTGFTPNGDGKNDRFIPYPVGITEIKYFRVYNRWGQLVFSTSRLNDGWDGKIGGISQATGTYIWMVQGVTATGRVITKKGTVILIR